MFTIVLTDSYFFSISDKTKVIACYFTKNSLTVDFCIFFLYFRFSLFYKILKPYLPLASLLDCTHHGCNDDGDGNDDDDDNGILMYFTSSHYDTCFIDIQNDKRDKNYDKCSKTIQLTRNNHDVFFNAASLQQQQKC